MHTGARTQTNKIDGEVRFGYLGETYAALKPAAGQEGGGLDGKRSRGVKTASTASSSTSSSSGISTGTSTNSSGSSSSSSKIKESGSHRRPNETSRASMAPTTMVADPLSPGSSSSEDDGETLTTFGELQELGWRVETGDFHNHHTGEKCTRAFMRPGVSSLNYGQENRHYFIGKEAMMRFVKVKKGFVAAAPPSHRLILATILPPRPHHHRGHSRRIVSMAGRGLAPLRSRVSWLTPYRRRAHTSRRIPS